MTPYCAIVVLWIWICTITIAHILHRQYQEAKNVLGTDTASAAE